MIHSLQTKNDEHEEITEQLQTKHDANVQQIIANLAALEQKVGEEKDKACQLEIESRAAEAEKIKLIQDQVTYHLIYITMQLYYCYCCVYRRNTVLRLRKNLQY